jgi:hypothetical protein
VNINALFAGSTTFINSTAVVFASIGLLLLSGAIRHGLIGRNRSLGWCLFGVALLLHGGFHVALKSSPHAVFSGYVLGTEDGSEYTTSSLWIYDLGFPQGDITSFDNAPYRELLLTKSQNDHIPASLWNLDSGEYLECDYRLWDRQITSIDAVPTPTAKAKGAVAWQWRSHSQGYAWPLLEALLGICAVCWSSLRLFRPGFGNAK